MIPFGEWKPDAVELDPTVSRIAQNVIPGFTGYRPFPTFTPYSIGSLNTRPIGAFSCVSASGTIHNFAGTPTRLYKASADGLNWNDCGRTTAYATPAENIWTFAQYGDLVVAQNGFDPAQVYTLDVSLKFADDTNIPIAQYMGIVRQFMVAARLLNESKTLAWSGIYDPLTWTPSDTTMADQQGMPNGGEITGYVGGEIGVLFQRRAIQRMVFTGPPLTFSFDKVSDTLGCRIPGTIAAYRDMIFFYSDNGFHVIRGGSQIDPIGEGKIDLWFAANLDSSAIRYISAAVNPIGKTYQVSFSSTAEADDFPDTILIYHWPTGKWSYVKQQLSWLYSAIVQSGYNLDTIDDLNPDPPNTTGIDGMDFSFDSAVFAGAGDMGLAAFDRRIAGEFRSGFFNGPPMKATVETVAIQPTEGKKSLLLGLRPLVEGNIDEVSAYSSVSDSLYSAFVQAPARDANVRGIVPMRVSGRYHRVGVVVPSGVGEWKTLIGVDDLNVIPQSA